MPLPLAPDAPTVFIRRDAFERAGLSRAALDERLNLTDQEFRVNLELAGDDDDKLDGDISEETDEGVARFGNVEVDEEGTFRLRAVADGLQSVESDAFQIFEDDD